MDLRWRLSHTRGYLQLGKLKEAEAELKSIDGEPAGQTEVAALWVALFHERRSWKKLQTLAADLVARDPNEVSWWVSWAYASRRVASIGRARAILMDALEFHPKVAVIQFNLGCYAAQLGELDEARRRVQLAIKLDKSFAQAARTDPDLEPLRSSADGGDLGGKEDV